MVDLANTPLASTPVASTRARRANISKAVLALVVSALAMMPTAASAAFYTGNELLERCEGELESIESALCLGFVMGVIDSIDAYQDNMSGVQKLICVPGGATGTELREIVTKYLRDNPKLRLTSAASNVWVAVREAYPCAK